MKSFQKNSQLRLFCTNAICGVMFFSVFFVACFSCVQTFANTIIYGDSMTLCNITTLTENLAQVQRVKELNTPAGITVDNAGNIIVADAGNYRVCKVSPKGEIQTLAGGNVGFADGHGTQAQFFNPIDVALAPDGSVIVLDGNRIRKITPKGDVLTLAGHNRGYADGAASIALFNIPVGIATDKQGNIFVADAGNSRIRKISADGIVSTLNTNTLFLPTGIATDANGNVLTIDHTNACVRKFQHTSHGSIIDTVIFRYVSEAQVLSLAGMTLDNKGNIIVLDHNGECIRKITASGNMITLVAKPIKQGKTTTQNTNIITFRAGDVTVDTQGTLFVTDLSHNSIRKISMP